MKISSNITDVINFLVDMRDRGYTSVELIDDSRACGWGYLEPTLEFIFNDESKVVGIDARTNLMKNNFKG